MINLIKLSNEIKIGLTVLVAVIVAFVGFKTMRDQPLFKKSTVLYTKFNDVSGLARGNIVLVKGFKIGSVVEMRLEESDSTRVVLNIDEGVKITKGSIIYLKSEGLLGNKYLELKRNPYSTELLEYGDSIEGIYEAGMLDSFGEKGTELADQITSSVQGIEKLVNNLNGTLTDANKNNIATTLAEFSELSKELNRMIEGKKEDIDAITESTRSILSTMQDLSTEKKDELGEMITSLESTSRNLDTLSKELNESTLSLNSILAKIDSGEGTLGKLVSDPTLYNNLDTLTVNLTDLIKNIQSDPKKYLKYMRLVEIF